MAVMILEFGSEISFGQETSPTDAPFSTKNINTFHLRGTEIEKILLENNRPVIYTERLSISGLNGPLPTPYAELIFRRTQAKDFAISDFLNIFNTRLLGISYRISRRRYLNLQNHDRACPLQRVISTFMGDSPEIMGRGVSRLSHLFWTKEKSAVGLEAVISAFFGFTTHIRQIQTHWVDQQRIQLLGNNTKLGINVELGKRLSVSSFGIEIHLTHLDYQMIFQLLLDNKYLGNLKCLVRKYLGDFFHCYLRLTPQNVPPLRMSGAFLGKTSWISGKTLDSAKIVC
jgi:type VI secretion system ImpH/TssG family protein